MPIPDVPWRQDQSHPCAGLSGRVSALVDRGRSPHPLLMGWEHIWKSAMRNGLSRRKENKAGIRAKA